MIFSFSKKLKLSEAFKRYFLKIMADDLLSKNSVAKYKEVAGMIVCLLGDISVKKLNGETINKLKLILNGRKLSPSRKNHFMILFPG